MGRYKNTIASSTPPGELEARIKAYMEQEGFSLKEGRGEKYWKKGMGLMLGPQFLKVEFSGGTALVEAWIKFAPLPGVYVGEMGVAGVFGLIPKRKLKGRVEAVEALLRA